jgi:hypothetical protein
MSKARTAATERFRFDPNADPWPEPDLNFFDIADYLAATRQRFLNEGELDFILNNAGLAKGAERQTTRVAVLDLSESRIGARV